jgi:uncharacterized protein (UPF0303 family)
VCRLQQRRRRIVLSGEREVFYVGFPGSTALGATILAAKWKTALRNGHSSLYERNVRLSRGTTFEYETDLRFPEHADFGGEVPLRTSERMRQRPT